MNINRGTDILSLFLINPTNATEGRVSAEEIYKRPVFSCASLIGNHDKAPVMVHIVMLYSSGFMPSGYLDPLWVLVLVWGSMVGVWVVSMVGVWVGVV